MGCLPNVSLLSGYFPRLDYTVLISKKDLVERDEMKAYSITCKTSPKARKTITFTRFYNSIEEARENCKKVLEFEQGYTVVSIIEAK